MSGLRYAALDLNGLARGKRVPMDQLEKLQADGARMPLSALNLDLWGADIAGSPLLFDSGDADGVLRAARDLVPMPWLGDGAQLLPMAMYHDDGRPFAGDATHALRAVLDRFAARGLTVIAATELEFYLLGPDLQPVAPPGLKAQGEDILSLDTLDAFDRFFTDLYAGAEAMGIPAQAAISESGVGQFEVNLGHQEAGEAAFATWAFKALVKGTARAHGLLASFAAKPMPSDAGNGLHVHFSVVDADGRNVFDDGSDEGAPVLRHAVQGCLAHMAESTLIFAPHANSYARFEADSHAPTGIAWGYENRTAAVRIPGGAPVARRIEHRVAGGDANPYLLLAAILRAALAGLEAGEEPPDPLSGNAYAQDLPQMPTDWDAAMRAFAQTQLFSQQLVENFCRTKAQEQARSAEADRDALHRLTVERL